MDHDVFISHSHHDKALADAACARLEAHGIRCWIAPRDVPPGANWAGAVAEAIGSARVFVLIFSGAVLESEQVAREITVAANNGLTIMPVRTENVEPTGSFVYYLSDRHWLDIIDGRTEEHLNTLAQTIGRVLDKPLQEPTTVVRPPTDQESRPAPQTAPKRSSKLIAALCVLGVVVGGWMLFKMGAKRPAFAPHGNSLAPAKPIKTETNAIDHAEMVWVPAGEFTMGSEDTDPDAGDDQKPAHKVYVDGYWIYKNDVTMAQFKAFCTATKRPLPKTPEFGRHDDHPVVDVSWDDAAAYAKWAGVSLPTEAQWEDAARGTDGRKFPWGNDWDPSLCAHSYSRPGDRGSTEVVGSFPKGASPYGALDMAGNVWNWCADYYDEHYYRVSPSRNPTGPVSGVSHVLRGGSWHYCKELNFRVMYRFSNVPDYTSYNIGFRCVSSKEAN